MCLPVTSHETRPVDRKSHRKILDAHVMQDLIVTMEENVASGGFGEKVREYFDRHHFGTRLLAVHVPDEYVEHGNVDILRRELGIDAETIGQKIMEQYKEMSHKDSRKGTKI